MIAQMKMAVTQPWARILLALFVSMALVLALAPTSFAADADADADAAEAGGDNDVLDTLGVNIITGDDPDSNFEGIALGQADLRVTIAKIINASLSLLGIIAVVVTLIGGFFWMTAGGNEEQIEKAKGWIFSGIIGLAIILSAFAISKFVIEKLGEATDVGGQP